MEATGKISHMLIISPEPPWPVINGWSSRNFQLIRALSEHTKCDVISLNQGSRETDLELRNQLGVHSYTSVPMRSLPRVLCAALSILSGRPMGFFLYRSSRLAATLTGVGKKTHYKNALILGDVCLAAYVKELKADSIVLDMCDDLAGNYMRRATATSGIRRAYFRRQAGVIRQFISQLSSRFDKVLAVSGVDREGLNSYLRATVMTVPLGVDTVRFSPREQEKTLQGSTMLFVGAMRSWPNRDAAKWFCSKVLPEILARIPTARLHIVGSGAEMLEIRNDAVVIRGFCEDLPSVYRENDIFVCPLRVGTGIKGKMLEAMACGCAIVATRIGIEGLGVVDGTHVLVADDKVEFANAVAALLDDPALRNRLGRAARVHATSELSLATVKNSLREVFQ